jgi:hypothetical protein
MTCTVVADLLAERTEQVQPKSSILIRRRYGVLGVPPERAVPGAAGGQR